MKKNTTLTIIAALIYSTGLAAKTSASTIDLPEYGFSIEALDATPSATSSTTAIVMFLPATDGFAPNINLNIQPYSGRIQEYISLSKAQFEKMNWRILNEKQTGDTEWTVEYTGQMKGSDLHYYARALSKAGKIYLITATTRDTQWNAFGEIIRSHVNSFKTK